MVFVCFCLFLFVYVGLGSDSDDWKDFFCDFEEYDITVCQSEWQDFHVMVYPNGDDDVCQLNVKNKGIFVPDFVLIRKVFLYMIQQCKYCFSLSFCSFVVVFKTVMIIGLSCLDLWLLTFLVLIVLTLFICVLIDLLRLVLSGKYNVNMEKKLFP